MTIDLNNLISLEENIKVLHKNKVVNKQPMATTQERNNLPHMYEYSSKMNKLGFMFPLKKIIILDIDSYKINSQWSKDFDTSLKLAEKSNTSYQVTESGSIHLFYHNDIEYYNSGKLEKYSDVLKGDFRTGKEDNTTSTGVRYAPNGVNDFRILLQPLSSTKTGKAILKERKIRKDKEQEKLKQLLENSLKPKVKYQDEINSYSGQIGTPYDLLTNLINLYSTNHIGAWTCIYGVIEEYKDKYSFDELWELLEETLRGEETDRNWLNNEADKWFKTKEKEAYDLYHKGN